MSDFCDIFVLEERNAKKQRKAARKQKTKDKVDDVENLVLSEDDFPKDTFKFKIGARGK